MPTCRAAGGGTIPATTRPADIEEEERMSSRTLKRIAAVLCLAAALAVPVHALPARSAEPLGFGDRLLTWAAELLSAVWAQDSAPDPQAPADEPPPPPETDEGHMIDPNG